MREHFRILVVDDEVSIRKRCIRLLSRQGYQVMGASDSTAALDLIEKKGHLFDLLLVDIRMPGMDGITLMGKVKTVSPALEIIIMTGYATVETAVKAMKYGAYDYLSKPFDADELLHVVDKVHEKKTLQEEIEDLRNQLKDSRERSFVFGSSVAMNRVMNAIEKIAPIDCNLLIYGESGTGKELAAKAIHDRSGRRAKPFVVADCAALSAGILESELFGHVKGAFTGAHTDRKGFFEKAHRGTLFLDEVSEIPMDLQGKLLRAVQEQTVVRLGSVEPVKVDVRIIAATNRDLEKRVKENAFRPDLFFRLNVVALTMPPLRERCEDIPVLAAHFLKYYTARLNLDQRLRIPDEILNMMCAYDWPGNVRELENAVQRAAVLADNGTIRIDHILPSGPMKTGFPDVQGDQGITFQEMRRKMVDDFTRQYLARCLALNEGNITKTAQAMNMRRTSLQRLMKQFGMSGKSFKSL